MWYVRSTKYFIAKEHTTYSVRQISGDRGWSRDACVTSIAERPRTPEFWRAENLYRERVPALTFWRWRMRMWTWRLQQWELGRPETTVTPRPTSCRKLHFDRWFVRYQPELKLQISGIRLFVIAGNDKFNFMTWSLQLTWPPQTINEWMKNLQKISAILQSPCSYSWKSTLNQWQS